MAGLDEVGRGSWAGPLTVGVAVVRPRVQLRSMPAWLRDSKMLSEARREEIFDAVGAWCEAWSVGHASPAECDEWGMSEALRVAARRALAGLGKVPDALLVDGPVDLLRHADDPFPGLVQPIVDGDAKCASVAAASVLAKVVRDRLMRQEAEHFPAYAFERNKGYPSPVHQTALRRVRALRDPPQDLGLRRRSSLVWAAAGDAPGAARRILLTLVWGRFGLALLPMHRNPARRARRVPASAW